MGKIPEISGVLRGNCCETCHYIPQKMPMMEFIKKNSITRQKLLGTSAATFYK